MKHTTTVIGIKLKTVHKESIKSSKKEKKLFTKCITSAKTDVEKFVGRKQID